MPLAPLNEKPITTIDPAALRQRTKEQRQEKFWGRLRCW